MVYIAFFAIITIALGLLGWWYYRELSINPSMTMSIALMYSLVSKQVSLLFIEMIPSYLPEQQLSSRFTGASYRILIMHLVFLIGVITACRLLNKLFPLRDTAEKHLLNEPPSIRALDVGLVISFFLLILQFVNILLSRGTAGLSSDFSRYDFWTESARFPILATLFGKTMAFVPPLIALATWGYGLSGRTYRQLIALVLLAPYLVFLYMTGHRFTITVLNMGLFLSVYMLLRILDGQTPISRAFAIGSTAVLILAIVIGSFDLANRHFARNSGGAVDAFFERAFVIQGATLWAVDDAVINGKLKGDPSYIIDGMSALRYATLKQENAEAYAEKGVNLSAGLPAICQLAFGPIYGSIIIVLFGLYLGFIFHFYSAIVARGSIIGLCMGALLLSWTNSLYGVASLRLLLDVKYCIFLALLLLLVLMPPFRITLGRRAHNPG